jgi:sec-independent protein translocase protein TatA
MAFTPGPTELLILLGLFFILFGAEKLPKMARALGQSKGEFQKGLAQTNNARDTLVDLEAGGRTPEQSLSHRAKAVGINPAGITSAELEKKVSALEALDSEE